MPAIGRNYYVDTSVLHMPGRNVNRYAHNMEVHLMRSALKRCPVGYKWAGPAIGFKPPRVAGRLRASHRGQVGMTGPATTTVRVSANASHALFVHEGTAWAVPHGPYPFKFWANHARDLIVKKFVNGQDPQPWLADALDVTMRRFTRAGG